MKEWLDPPPTTAPRRLSRRTSLGLLAAGVGAAAVLPVGHAVHRWWLTPDPFRAETLREALRSLSGQARVRRIRSLLVRADSIEANCYLDDYRSLQFRWQERDWTRLGEVNHALWPGRDWLPVEALPLDSIAPAAALPATTAPVVRLIVDSLGRTTLMREDHDRSLHANGGWMPRLDLSSVSGARAAMVELAAATGPTATAVGSFGDSLWVDLWHAPARRQLRAWRSPDSPVRTRDIWGGEEAQPPPMFDPATIDPAQALQGWSTIVERAGLRRGRVTSWAYRIPRLQHQDRGPLLVYSIGSTPAVQVWVGPDDEVISVEATDY